MKPFSLKYVHNAARFIALLIFRQQRQSPRAASASPILPTSNLIAVRSIPLPPRR